jgi:hypothetical protein
MTTAIYPDFLLELIPMPEYRAQRIGRDGLIFSSTKMNCRNDGDAIHQAEIIAQGFEIEIWCDNRLVERLPDAVQAAGGPIHQS